MLSKFSFRILLMSALCLAVVAGSVSFMGRESVSADTKVEINTTTFPDETFRNYVLETYDNYMPYGSLDEEEIKYATQVWITDKKDLKSLKGIEYLTNLEMIYAYGCGIGSVDLSQNTNLKVLSLSDNNLKSLNVKPLTKLRELFVRGNQISSLDLSNNPDIMWLDVSDTNISSIDLSNFSELTEFRCEGCKSLTSIDVSHNSKLQLLLCSGCSLKTIKFGSHPDLNTLSCGQNELTSLDISSFSKLHSLYCIDNKISTFKMGSHPELLDLLCWNNKISKLDVSSCSKLIRLDFSNNQIKSINVNNCSELSECIAKGNPLKSLSIDKCYKLAQLDVVNTELTTLVCPPSEKLFSLMTYPSKITKINISGCKMLIDAYKDHSANDYDSYYSHDMFDGSNSGYFTYGKNVKILTNGNIEPTDTPTPTPTPVADISDNTSEITVPAGTKVRIDASVLGSKPYNWSSSDKTIATVDSNGYVTGKKAGTVTITVTKGEKKLTCKVTVKGNASPTATPAADKNTTTTASSAIPVVCGKAIVINPAAVLGKGTYSFKSSDTKIATVDSSGKVSAKMAGSVSITVTLGKKKFIQPVTVLYKDVTNTKDFWYAPTNYLTAKNVVKGYDKQTNFKPANDCTRAQMVTFLWRLAGTPAPKSTTTNFKDIKSTDYFYKPVLWAVEKGITTGVSKTKFNPQGVCTRAQTVTFLWRMAKKPDPKSTTNKFKDVKKTDYFYKATLWASEKKILAGYSDGTFKPQGKCLRRQMVTFLYKYDKYVNGKG